MVVVDQAAGIDCEGVKSASIDVRCGCDAWEPLERLRPCTLIFVEEIL
jgi:hypothetical protein